MRLVVQNLSFNYPGHPVLQEVALEAEAGELFSLVGPNGSGKSTCLKCLARVLRPAGGAVYLDGRDVAGLSGQELATRLGYVPQETPQVFPLTVYEAVLLGRKPYLNWSVSVKDRRVVEEVLRLLRLEHLAARTLDQLSGGEKQRVALARALAQEPQLLLLDEPTANLDIRHQLELLGLLQSLARRRGITVFLVLHDLNLAARFAEKMLLLHQGRVFAVGSPRQVLSPENIRAVYGVEARLWEDGVGLQVVALCPTEGWLPGPAEKGIGPVNGSKGNE